MIFPKKQPTVLLQISVCLQQKNTFKRNLKNQLGPSKGQVNEVVSLTNCVFLFLLKIASFSKVRILEETIGKKQGVHIWKEIDET